MRSAYWVPLALLGTYALYIIPKIIGLYRTNPFLGDLVVIGSSMIVLFALRYLNERKK